MAIDDVMAYVYDVPRHVKFAVKELLMNRCSIPTLIALVISLSSWSRAQEESADPTVEDALARGVEILLRNQERYKPDRLRRRVKDDELAEWSAEQQANLDSLRKKKQTEWPYEGVYTVRRQIPAGYRVGGTAIVCEALILAAGYEESDPRKAAIKRAIAFMLEQLEKNPKLEAGPKSGYDVRGWAHTYALDFFLLAIERGLVEKKITSRVNKMVKHLIKCIAANECQSGGERRGRRRRRREPDPAQKNEPKKKVGGWNYAGGSPSPFMTGSTLIALFRAKAAGFSVDAAMVERALSALEKSRLDDTGSYVYSGAATGGSARRAAMPGACARAAVAELCLFRAGRSDETKLRVAVDAFFGHWDELLKRKSKQGTHEGPYGIAPYYFYYGHTYAALAIEHLPEADRPALRAQMQETLWKTRDTDGGWNDRVFLRTQSYSTAMSMLALLAPKIGEIPAWSHQ